MSHLDAHELIDLVLDDGSWASWDGPVEESVLTGEGLLRGRRVAVLVSEFGHQAGSIGRVAADRLVAAVERATAEGLPLLAAPASGGTRMQEGTSAFLQMIRISAAIAGHKAAGLPYLVYLRHPTTGGVMASWGSLAHVTVAEPGALVGFLGPRVYEALYGHPFPEGVQTSENLYLHGIVDAVAAAGRDRRHPAPRGRDPDVPPGDRRTHRSRPTTRSPRSTPGTRSRGRGGRTAPACAGCCGTPPPT